MLSFLLIFYSSFGVVNSSALSPYILPGSGVSNFGTYELTENSIVLKLTVNINYANQLSFFINPPLDYISNNYDCYVMMVKPKMYNPAVNWFDDNNVNIGADEFKIIDNDDLYQHSVLYKTSVNLAEIVLGHPDTSGSGTASAGYTISLSVFFIDKNSSSDDADRIIQAIIDQTNSINSSIGQQTDEIKNAISNQYEMNDNEDFGIGQIQQDYKDKMGVLSFGSDTLINFLDLFDPSTTGGTGLTFPGFTLNISNTSYEVWPSYTFDLKSLEGWLPELVSVIRLILPVMVWLGVLKYIIMVAEKYFMSGGG